MVFHVRQARLLDSLCCFQCLAGRLSSLLSSLHLATAVLGSCTTRHQDLSASGWVDRESRNQPDDAADGGTRSRYQPTVASTETACDWRWERWRLLTGDGGPDETGWRLWNRRYASPARPAILHAAGVMKGSL
ncbi:hypothetical protein B0T21DRAFT_362879 [Apiosordaria backusii]|uniref:Uncharacterized protein n=1 Tax=Apiosordaria backusii TaxID=314023 RepID=A0AA40BSK8_9PEZI|nr:hypothetical protein B0T21DRAFT_362879 [Apiosordaria backusii]